MPYVYTIVTFWKYPQGGGEEFMYQTMMWATKLGYTTYWLCFATSDNKPFDELKIDITQYGTILCIPNGLKKGSLYNWLKLINPHFVHHQGHHRKLIFDVCDELRITFLTGFHFWTGGIILNPETNNINILENASKHKVDDEFTYLQNKQLCKFYTVTPFVSDCIEAVTGVYIPDHIYASSSVEKIKMDDFDVLQAGRYVSIINIHVMKGGEIVLHLIKELPDIPFCIVRTEAHSDELDKKIMDAINERTNTVNAKKCLVLPRQSDPTVIYRQTRIMLVPSIVDETFCRVANEAMMNGIPVITTGQGNIKELVKNDGGIVVDASDLDGWVSTVKRLYHSPDELKYYSEHALKQYEEYSEERAFTLFKKLVTKTVKSSKEMNIMIFTPWCDQGLGIQSRNYADILKENGFNVVIFSVKPYIAESSLDLQQNKDEWSNYEVYYSPNDREHVKDYELIQLVKTHNVGKCLLPETCWFRVFEIAKLMRKLNVKCYAIPNIEIVRKDELFKHRNFYKILCNNYLCKNIFDEYGVTNTEYIGYGIKETKQLVFKHKEIVDDSVIQFLFIGGMNAFSRKQIISICEGFSEAYETVKNIRLTCTIQKTNLLEVDDRNSIQEYLNHEAINIIQTHLSYSDIIKKYNESHVSIQVSKHEGLGLGFYEALCTGTPVITLDTPPHNEIIKHNVNGWIIPCSYKKMLDNKDPIFDSAYFDKTVLANTIIDIASDIDKYTKLLTELYNDYNQRIQFRHFKKRFIASLT